MYQFKSLGIESNFLMDTFLANTIEKDEYFVIQTPGRPNYFWGNYILMKKPPVKGDFEKWVNVFETEVGEKRERGFCAITFDLKSDETFDASDFFKNKFRIGIDKILIADKIIKPEKFNAKLTVREYELSKNLNSYIEVHFDNNWPYGDKAEQEEFLMEQAMSFSSLVSKDVAKRFGCYLNNKLVADLGIYWNDKIVRFNSISTHQSYRRLGACSTLVYSVSKKLFEQNPNTRLVMQADENYHAALIYESIGFKPKEKVITLEWKDDSKFSNSGG